MKRAQFFATPSKGCKALNLTGPEALSRLLMTPILSVKQRPFRVLRRRAEGPDLFEVRCQLRSLVRDENRDELGWFGAAGVG